MVGQQVVVDKRRRGRAGDAQAGVSRRLLPDLGCDDRADSGFHGRLALGCGFLKLCQLQIELVDEPVAALTGLAALLTPRLGEQLTGWIPAK